MGDTGDCPGRRHPSATRWQAWAAGAGVNAGELRAGASGQPGGGRMMLPGAASLAGRCRQQGSPLGPPFPGVRECMARGAPRLRNSSLCSREWGGEGQPRVPFSIRPALYIACLAASALQLPRVHSKEGAKENVRSPLRGQQGCERSGMRKLRL